MPDSLAGLALFVVFLAPGLAYVAIRERRFPSRNQSAFRETATVVFVSTAVNIGVIAGFGAVRMIAPSRTPDLGRLVRDAGTYVKSNYGVLGAWAIGLLIVACALAGLLAYFSPRLRDIRWLSRLGDVTFESAWHVVLHEEVDKVEPSPFVGCELDDGSYIGGTLLSFSSEIDETADREISLVAPVFYRSTGADSDSELANVGTATVSSRRIKFLTVTYFKQPAGTGGSS